MKKKMEICGAQSILPTPNETTSQPYNEVTRQVLVNKFSDFNLVNNFRFVWEKTKDYLQKIAETPGTKRNAAIEIAKKDINFGANAVAEVELTLQQRIDQEHKESKKMKY